MVENRYKHRRWQFGLRSLLVVVTVAAVVVGAIRAWDWGAPTPDWQLIKVGMSKSEAREIIGKGHSWFSEGGLFVRNDTIDFARGGALRIDYEGQRVVSVTYLAGDNPRFSTLAGFGTIGGVWTGIVLLLVWLSRRDWQWTRSSSKTV
jgi:hypothetical protein